MKQGVVGTAVAVVAALVACTEEGPVKKAGMYKDAAWDRLFVATVAPGTTLEQLKAFGQKRTHTKDRITVVYFYPAGATLPQFPLANAVREAQDKVFETGGHSHVFVRRPDGSMELASCGQPAAGICLKENVVPPPS